MGGEIRTRNGQRLRPALCCAIWIVCLCISLLSFAYLPRMLDMRMECRMARMLPSYVVHDEQLQQYSRSDSPVMKKYSLREYREMGYHMPNKWKEQPLYSMPVLFIPGNAGSFAQVRSLASSAFYQYWTRNGHDPRPDMEDVLGPTVWYTVDFNEDFSAFHGGTLEDQAFFVNEVLRYLRAQYDSVPPEDDAASSRRFSDDRNTTIGIVGHSMGGIVARLAMTLPNYPVSSVDTIVTLSTPHAYPPVPFERSMDRVYDRIHRHMRDEPLIISLAGGLLDTQLSSDATSLTLDGHGSPMSRLSSFTTSAASLWSSTDHLAIVWCDQLRYRIARAFLRDYAFFHRIAEARALPDVRKQRRELWRRVLGIVDDAASPQDKSLALATADLMPTLMVFMRSRIMPTDLASRQSMILTHLNVTNVHVHVLRLITPPGPRQQYGGMTNDTDEALAFELVSNLSYGSTSNRGMYVPQNHELFVSVCRRQFRSRTRTMVDPAWCHPIWTNGLEYLPYSPAKEREPGTKFPDAHLQYDVPSISLSRLHLSAAFLRKYEIDSVRIEYTVNPAEFPTSENVSSILTYGWTEDKPLVLRGTPGWFRSRTWELPGLNVSSLLSSYVEHGPLWEWDLPDVDSALLAYTFTLVPAPCASRFHPPPPVMAPMVRFISASTGDVRIFPSLRLHESNHLHVALHGVAPFIQEPKHRGTRLQFWLLDEYIGTPFSGTFDSTCPLPYASIHASIHWRASIALLVLRYRLALLVWPLGILALARIQSSHSPSAALASLTHGRGLLIVLLAPIALHVCVFFGASLGVPRHTLGIGITSLHFWWLGPVLAMTALSLAMLMHVVVESLLCAWYILVRRLAPRYLPLHTQPTQLKQAPRLHTWLAWTRQPSTWLAACVLTAFLVFMPYQVLILLCTIVHMATTCSSYMAFREAERHASLNDTAGVLRARHAEHLWLLHFLLWLLPLQAPMLVVWVRNVNAGLTMGFSSIQYKMWAVAPLLWLIYLFWVPWTLSPPAFHSLGFEHARHVVYGTMSLCALLYGVRYSYFVLDAFVVTVLYELIARIAPLYIRPPKPEAIPMNGTSHLNVPASLPNKDAACPTVSRPPGDHTDHLWEEYLDTLDAYMHARAQAEQAMKHGFAQLTRAKMALNGGVFGQRLGRDLYDERMSARIRIQPETPGATASVAQPLARESASTESNPATLRRRLIREKEPHDVKHPDTKPGCSSSREDDPDHDEHPTTRHPQGFDPLFQFSGLPPRSLKAAQREFQRALGLLLDTNASTKPVEPLSHNVWRLQNHLYSLETELHARRNSS